MGWLRGGGKKQTRLQKGEPSGHDQIVGGELEPKLARRLDELEVLLGERQDRDARQVDPLPSGKLQQQVERAFETVEVDSESRFARGLDKVEVDSKRVRSGNESPPRRMLTHRRGAGKGRGERVNKGVDRDAIATRSLR